MSLEVSVTDLIVAGVAVTGIGDDLASCLARVEGRLESACAGWQGLSGSSLSVVVQQWSASDASLLSRLSTHADDLHGCAASFWETEQVRASVLGAP